MMGKTGKPAVLEVLSYYHPNVSGLTISAAEQAAAFLRRGHGAAVITSRLKGQPAREVIEGVKVFRSKVALRIGKAPLMPLYPYDMWQALDETDFLIIHMPCPEAGIAALLARLRGRQVLISYDASISKGDWISRLTRIAVAGSHLLAGLMAKRIQVISPEYAENSDFCRLFRRKLRFAPLATPFPPEQERFLALRREAASGALHIGYVGRLARQKNIGLLIEAFQRLAARFPRPLVLDLCGPASEIIGETDWRDTLAAVEASNGAIRYHGVLHGADLRRFYGGLDLMVLPSTDRQESFGLVQVEAMLQGVPVAASDLAGMREPVRQTGMGMLFRPGDIEHMAEVMEKLLTEGPPHRADLAELTAIFGEETSCAPFFDFAAELAGKPQPAESRA